MYPLLISPFVRRSRTGRCPPPRPGGGRWHRRQPWSDSSGRHHPPDRGRRRAEWPRQGQTLAAVSTFLRAYGRGVAAGGLPGRELGDTGAGENKGNNGGGSTLYANTYSTTS